jgi:hypothetical protein
LIVDVVVVAVQAKISQENTPAIIANEDCEGLNLRAFANALIFKKTDESVSFGKRLWKDEVQDFVEGAGDEQPNIKISIKHAGKNARQFFRTGGPALAVRMTEAISDPSGGNREH